MKAHQLINQDSGDTEYYTPPFILEAARKVLGRIDLDPFSSKAANAMVKADRFFTPVEDGLKQPWAGKFWMNHPFGRTMNKACIQKAISEYERGAVTEGLCITYAATSEGWFKPLLELPQCFLVPRTNYLMPDGSVKRGVTKGSVVTYFGRNVDVFAAHFAPLGVLKVGYTAKHQRVSVPAADTRRFVHASDASVLEPPSMVGFPQGKLRLRIRAGEFVKAFVYGENGVRAFYVLTNDGVWTPGPEIWRNDTVR